MKFDGPVQLLRFDAEMNFSTSSGVRRTFSTVNEPRNRKFFYGQKILDGVASLAREQAKVAQEL